MTQTSSASSSPEALPAGPRILFIVSSAKIGFWLAELTHPFWHFSERGAEITLASPDGGAILPDRTSDPYSENSWEANDLVSKGFLSDPTLVARLSATVALRDVSIDNFDGVHIVGGGGAAVDLYPNADVTALLDAAFANGKVVGTICHGSIALANVPERVSGRAATGFSRIEDAQVEDLYGKDFVPNFPQPVMEAAGIRFSATDPWGIHVVVDGNLVSGQNQQSASEYSIAYLHLLTGNNPVMRAGERDGVRQS
ncbi:type 1 glutamine amidotransferase domain-containing protein [Sphingobium amiense]|uniref:Type 1 glutamine amidotransferase domain-containing protein n=1 Tax=Sphingobium amiense TaxID=135719 RepID=A0A494W0X1_9SPHN|nr:type 1 glutamine amidotransferase domain-containing protein [Sphingobium amiense]BBD96966.1 type 1 glutamine amidotransferase domain-containing protein [Sphingobium amiense]